MENKSNKCGYIAFIGSPNSGKSTLLNACVGTKVSIVSNKPQTTRNKILGIFNQNNIQFLFLDTPGIHETYKRNKLNFLMNNEAWNTLNDADVICYLIDVTKGFSENDSLWIETLLKKFEKSLFILGSKSDKVKKHQLSDFQTNISEQIKTLCSKISSENIKAKLCTPIPLILSAKRPLEIKSFINNMSEFIPESPWLYDKDDLTDRNQKFMCSEMIREQVFRQLGDEIPYSSAVTVSFFEHKPNIVHIGATILVERESHKAIVVGSRGSRIKSIGQEARSTLEKHLEMKVYLELFVKVRSGWTDDSKHIEELVHLGA